MPEIGQCTRRRPQGALHASREPSVNCPRQRRNSPGASGQAAGPTATPDPATRRCRSDRVWPETLAVECHSRQRLDGHGQPANAGFPRAACRPDGARPATRRQGHHPKDLGKLEADQVRRQEESYFSGELGPIEGGNTFMSKSKVTSPWIRIWAPLRVVGFDRGQWNCSSGGVVCQCS